MSSVLLGGPPPPTPTQPPQPSGAPDGAASQGRWQRDSTVTVIAGVGVLLLAMGVGVLIGRSGGSSQHAATSPQVITVAPTGGGAGAAGTAAGGAVSVTDEWPAGTIGYTVQLQTLPVSGTSASGVAAAKSAATAKGAKGVGVLKSDDFKSLTAGHYVIYSGVYHTRAQASKALGALKKSFPGASVIAVSSAGAGSAPAASGGGGGPAKPPPPSSLSHPAGPSVLKHLREGSGKSYEQKSKELPNVITTG